jgi:hypothetical protein
MGQYKVPQDVEAEDKIIGPLTMRQFIYAIIGIMWGVICFAAFRKVIPLMIVIGLPPVMLFLLLAFYKRDGQNFEQLLVAMAGYFGQSRRRLWAKEPLVEAFQITATKITSSISQRNPAEVRSQLEQLGAMIDARGQVAASAGLDDDRIYLPAQPVASNDEPEQPDVYDVPAAAPDPLAQLIQQSVQNLKAEAIEQMRREALQEAPAPHKARPKTTAPVTSSTMTQPVSGDIIRLATENDDLTVSQIAAQAGRNTAPLAEGESVTLRDVPSKS